MDRRHFLRAAAATLLAAGVHPRLVLAATSPGTAPLPRSINDGLHAQGFHFYGDRWGSGVVRLVTSFATQAADVDAFIAGARSLGSS